MSILLCREYATDAQGFYLDICVLWEGITIRLSRNCNGKKQSKNPSQHLKRCAQVLLSPVIGRAREIFGEATKGIPIKTVEQLALLGDSLRQGCIDQGGGVHQALSSTSGSAAIPVLKTVFFLVVVVLKDTDGLLDSAKKMVWHGYASGKLNLWLPDVPEVKAITMAKELHASMPFEVQNILGDVDQIKRDVDKRLNEIELMLKKLQESPTRGLRRSVDGDPAAAIGSPGRGRNMAASDDEDLDTDLESAERREKGSPSAAPKPAAKAKAPTPSPAASEKK